MELALVGLLVLLAILGPWLGADSRVPGGGWIRTPPGGKLWPDPLVQPDRPSGRGRRRRP